MVYTPSMFVQDAGSGFASLRTAEHLIQNPEYPDPMYYLSFLGKYFYRNKALRHLRIEQFQALIGIRKRCLCVHRDVIVVGAGGGLRVALGSTDTAC